MSRKTEKDYNFVNKRIHTIKEYIQEAVNLNMDIIEKLNTCVILIPRIKYKELYKIND